jgi:hypothetical protein
MGESIRGNWGVEIRGIDCRLGNDYWFEGKPVKRGEEE